MRQSPTSRYAAPLARASTWRACWSLLAASWLALAFGTAATAATFTFAGSHSSVTISWSHAGLSRHSARIVGVDGTLEFEPADPQSATVEARLDPARLSTGVPALDRLLRSPDFFDVASHPVIAFRSTAARITGERTGEVLGDLTVAGVTRPVALTVTWNFAG
ncbi:MAG: YceI family protein, partial [Hyphomicrobiaceae bacterium]